MDTHSRSARRSRAAGRLLAAVVGTAVLGGGVAAGQDATPDVQPLLAARYAYRPGSALVVRPPADDRSAAALTFAVAVGHWDVLKSRLADLPPADAAQVYRRVLDGLSAQMAADPSTGLTPRDVLALADALPADQPVSDADVHLVGQLLGRSINATGLTADVQSTLTAGTPHFGGPTPDGRGRAAALLMYAGRPGLAAAYLPSPAEAVEVKDPAVSLLVFEDAVAAAAEADGMGHPDQAVRLRRAALPIALALLNTNPPPAVAGQLVNGLVNLCSSLGDTQALVDWLADLDRRSPADFYLVLSQLAKPVPPAAGNLSTRVAAIDLQRQLVGLLLKSDPASAAAGTPRQAALELLADDWVNEAAFANTKLFSAKPAARSGPPADPPNPATTTEPIDFGLLLQAMPDGPWLADLRPETRLRCRSTAVPLAMAADQTDAGLRLIDEVAKSLPDSADRIGFDAVAIWAERHSSGQVRVGSRQTAPVPVGIPLTQRSQQRRVDTLVSLVDGIAKAYGHRISPSLLVKVFAAVNGQSEVYHTADVEVVLGPVDQLDPETMLAFATLMRENLSSTWRDANVQNAFATGRDPQAAAAAVRDGYATLVDLLQREAARSGDYRVYATLAGVRYEQATYTREQVAGLDAYAAARAAVFDAVHRAADAYARTVTSIRSGAETDDVYGQWLAMALGGTSLAHVNGEEVTDYAELDRLNAALHALPGDAARRHLDLLAADADQGLSKLPAESKQRTLRAVAAIIGDGPLSQPVRAVLRTYDDLLSEVNLTTRVDGPTRVGVGQPFGFVLQVESTEQLDRATHGFGRYVSEQVSAANAIGAHGAPVGADPRGDLEKQIRLSLLKGFDVVSIAWAAADVASLPEDGRPGWRVTPLAYVVAKAKDASVDRVAPVRIDLNFFDNLNTFVMAIDSGGVAVDARQSVPRPTGQLEVGQTLDDHDVANGSASLAVTAAGPGLVPDLNRLVDLGSIRGFHVTAVRDEGLKLDALDAQPTDSGDYAAHPAVTAASHRQWTVALAADPAVDGVTTFHFPSLAVPFDGPAKAKATYARLSDADATPVDPATAALGFRYATRRTASPWLAAFGLAVLAAVAAGATWAWRRLRPSAPPAVAPSASAAPVTLFATLAMLRRARLDLERSGRADAASSLVADIAQLERHYFAGPNGTARPSNGVDLAELTRKWSGN